MDRRPAALRPDSDRLRTAVAEPAQADPLDALAVLRDLDGWIGNPTTWAVLAACRRGATWSEVGEALGTTEQAAHERSRSLARGDTVADSAWLYAAAPQQARPVGEVLRTWRQAHGLTQRQLGRMVGFDQTYVSKVEAGQRVIRDVDTLRLLAHTLGIAPKDLGLACDAGDDPDGPRGTATRTPTDVADGQRARRGIRRFLNRHRVELSAAAAALYPPTDRLGALLTRPGWLLDTPVDLADVTLDWTAEATPPALDGTEPQARPTMPATHPSGRYAHYSRAIRDLDRPTLFNNTLSYRLLEVAAGPRLTFGHTTYFDAVDVCEAVAHETARVAETATPDGLRWGRLPFRQLVGDPFDLSRRPLLPSINTVTIRAGRPARFVLHRRNAGHVAVAGGMYHVMPAGVFQPSGISPAHQAHDFDLWRNVMREYSEEYLGVGEHDGSSSRLVDYDHTEPFRSMYAARRDGTLRVFYLGLGLDALTLFGEILTVAVFAADLFDRLFDGLVPVNSEGAVVLASPAGRAADGLPFDEPTVRRLLEGEPLAPSAAACLHLAWRSRAQILADLAG